MAIAIKHAQCAVGTSATTLVTGASGGSLVKGLTIANIDGTNPVDITVEVTDTSAGVTRKLLSTYSLDAERALSDFGIIALESGDVLKITAGVAGDAEATAAVLEFT